MKQVTSEEFRTWNATILNEAGGELGEEKIVDNDGNLISAKYLDWDSNIRAQLIDGLFYIDESWDYTI
jgi:hypothetical protein